MPQRKISFEDAALARAELIVSNPAAADVDLAAEYAALAKSYRSLLRKLNKTLVISDGYQSQLRELNASLATRVEEQTERRVRQERMLLQQSKLAAMGEMIAAIAHQWRQPLSIVSAIIQNVREASRMGELSAGYVEKASGDALSQIRLMSETVGAFQEFFQPAKGAEAFSVSAKIKEAATLMQAQLKASGIALLLREAAEDDTIDSFPNEFTQVILNLIANGRDAILKRRADGLGAAADEISIAATAQGAQVTVEIADNGCGISPEIAGRLFEPYFTTKNGGGGTGIGLYMSRLIIEESMGGKLSFSSDRGRTAFRIQLARGNTA